MKLLSLAKPAWTFGAGVVPWRHLVGLFWHTPTVSFTVRDTMLLIDRHEALP